MLFGVQNRFSCFCRCSILLWYSTFGWSEMLGFQGKDKFKWEGFLRLDSRVFLFVCVCVWASERASKCIFFTSQPDLYNNNKLWIQNVCANFYQVGCLGKTLAKTSKIWNFFFVKRSVEGYELMIVPSVDCLFIDVALFYFIYIDKVLPLPSCNW